MALSTEHRASLLAGLSPVVGEAAAEALVHHLPATEDQEPATAAFVERAIDDAMVSLKGEMALEFAAVRTEMADESAALRTQLAAESAALRMEMGGLAGVLRAEMALESGLRRAEVDSLASVLRSEMEALGSVLRSEMETQGVSLRSEMEALGMSLRSETEGLRSDMAQGFVVMSDSLHTDLAEAGQRFHEGLIHQTRWFTAVMVGAMASVAGMAGVVVSVLAGG